VAVEQGGEFGAVGGAEFGALEISSASRQPTHVTDLTHVLGEPTSTESAVGIDAVEELGAPISNPHAATSNSNPSAIPALSMIHDQRGSRTCCVDG
jgi:hypothetical protein